MRAPSMPIRKKEQLRGLPRFGWQGWSCAAARLREQAIATAIEPELNQYGDQLLGQKKRIRGEIEKLKPWRAAPGPAERPAVRAGQSTLGRLDASAASSPPASASVPVVLGWAMSLALASAALPNFSRSSSAVFARLRSFSRRSSPKRVA